MGVGGECNTRGEDYPELKMRSIHESRELRKYGLCKEPPLDLPARLKKPIDSLQISATGRSARR